MENLLRQLANGGGEITSEGLDAQFRFNLDGSIRIIKGGLSYTLNFYAYLTEMGYIDNCVTIEDLDVQESYGYTCNGIPIDDIEKLKETLRNSGLSSISKSLEIEWRDERAAIAKEIEKNQLFRKIYGKNTIVWEALTEYEQKLFKLQNFISNYEKVDVANYFFKDFMTEENKFDDEGNVVLDSNGKPIVVKLKPSIEDLKELLKELKDQIK